MPLVSPERSSQYWEPVAGGPVAQADYSTAVYASPQGTISATGDFFSSVINADGFKLITVAATSNQSNAGNLLGIQLYVDGAGTIPQGAQTNVTMTTAGTSYVNNVNGALTPFQSFKVNIHNGAASPATITGYALLLTAA